jgi:hypothetical protein
MEENLNQQKQPVRQALQGEAGGPAPYASSASNASRSDAGWQSDAGESISEPPATSVTVRTMESDIKAVEQGGGELTAPQPFTPSGIKPEEPKFEAQLGIPGYIGPEKPIFTSTAAISSVPAPDKKSSKWKITGIIIAILIIVAGLGLLGYFVIFPLLFPAQMPAVQ